MDFIHGRICEKYSDPMNAFVPYEGGLIFEGQSIDDLLFELGLDINTDEVYNKITEYLSDHNWIESEWNMPDDPYFSNWEYFCNYVKKKRRFFFSETKSPPIIDILKQLIEKNNLIKKLKPGTVFYRARAFKEGAPEPEHSIKTLGPPKSKDIMNRSSRMSPAGIPIFYCSNKEGIAVKEISDLKRTGYAIIGKIHIKKRAMYC